MQKRISIPFLTILILFGSIRLHAQVPVRDTLHVNSIQASVQSNGAFFLAVQMGNFLSLLPLAQRRLFR
ncbi:MAG: hypothetical protein IPH31_18630 [Lewinellaceae bacterium]|nr:hypothetical protein [Lewinellaceae bacterium]